MVTYNLNIDEWTWKKNRGSGQFQVIETHTDFVIAVFGINDAILSGWAICWTVSCSCVFLCDNNVTIRDKPYGELIGTHGRAAEWTHPRPPCAPNWWVTNRRPQIEPIMWGCRAAWLLLWGWLCCSEFSRLYNCFTLKLNLTVTEELWCLRADLFCTCLKLTTRLTRRSANHRLEFHG